MNHSTRRAAMLGLLLTLAVPVALAADPASKATGPSTLSRDDMKFFQKAAQTGMFEVQAAAIASSRALAPATRDFASASTLPALQQHLDKARQLTAKS